LTIKTALLSLQALLCSPEPDDPQDAEVANIYKKDRKTFEQTGGHALENCISFKTFAVHGFFASREICLGNNCALGTMHGLHLWCLLSKITSA